MPLSVVISIYLFIYFAINLEIEKKKTNKLFLNGNENLAKGIFQ